MMDNIIASKLYRAGSVGYVSKSGGMSNELNSILSLFTNGTCEGIAIGGDRYPGSTFIGHLLRYKQDPECKMLVLLGEAGGIEEYRVIDAVKQGVIKKPIVAWTIGTCAKSIIHSLTAFAAFLCVEPQFSHCAHQQACSTSVSKIHVGKMRAKEVGMFIHNTFLVVILFQVGGARNVHIDPPLASTRLTRSSTITPIQDFRIKIESVKTFILNDNDTLFNVIEGEDTDEDKCKYTPFA